MPGRSADNGLHGAGEHRDIAALRRRPTTLTFHEEPAAEGYNLLIGRIGSPISESSCHLSAWSDRGGGLLSLEATLEAGTWVVVTASNAAGEGPAGSGSRGGERSLRPGWSACGASP